jgi:hypothetical protein
MIINNDFSIFNYDSQLYVYDNNYLIVSDNLIVHKATGLIIYGNSDLERLNQFVEKWGYSQLFQFGMVDCYVDGVEVKLNDYLAIQLIGDLIVAFFYQEYHPMAWLLW